MAFRDRNYRSVETGYSFRRTPPRGPSPTPELERLLAQQERLSHRIRRERRKQSKARRSKDARLKVLLGAGVRASEDEALLGRVVAALSPRDRETVRELLGNAGLFERLVRLKRRRKAAEGSRKAARLNILLGAGVLAIEDDAPLNAAAAALSPSDRVALRVLFDELGHAELVSEGEPPSAP